MFKPDYRIRCASCGREGKDHPTTGHGCTDVLEAIVKHCYLLTMVSSQAVVRAQMAEAFPGTQLGLLSVEKVLAICHGILYPYEWASIAGDWSFVDASPSPGRSPWSSGGPRSQISRLGPRPAALVLLQVARNRFHNGQQRTQRMRKVAKWRQRWGGDMLAVCIAPQHYYLKDLYYSIAWKQLVFFSDNVLRHM